MPTNQVFDIFNGLMALLGLFQLRFDKKTNTHKISYIKLIYHFFILSGIVYLAYGQVVHLFPRGLDHDIGFILVVYYPRTVGHVMTFLLILSYSITTKKAAKMLNSKYFSEAVDKINRSQLSRSYAKQLFLFLFFTVLYIGQEILTRGPKSNFILEILGANDFTVYNVASTAQYYLSMTSLIILVKFLNDNLRKIRDSAMELNFEREGKWSGNKENKDLRRTVQVFYMSMNREEVGQSAVADSTGDKEINVLNNILEMRRFYQSIFKISMAFNNTCALRILLLVFHHTIIIIINLYSILRDTMEFSYQNRPSFVSNFLKSLSLSLVSILWIVVPARKLFNEIHTTSYVVQDIITRSPLPAIVDGMELFSIQLLQEKLLISPFGFFEVANKLMLHLLGLVTTYLVILLQFKVMTDDLKSKNLTLPYERPGDFPRFFHSNHPPSFGPHDGPPDGPFDPQPPPPPIDNYDDNPFPPEPREPPPF